MASNENTPRIVELAAQISNSVAQLQEKLSAEGLPSPSFDENFPGMYPAGVAQFRDAVLDASAELHELLLDPLMVLFKFASISNLVSIDAVARYKIPDMIPAGSHMSFEEIGQKTGLEKNVVRRLLRNAMSMRILQEPEPGMVGHTSISKFLANPAINGWAQFEGRDTWPATTRIVDAIQKWPNSQEPNETGWVLANNGKTVPEIIATEPERAMRFANGMRAIDWVPGYNLSLLPTVYDWASLGDVKIVHVGGSMGEAAIELARNFSNLTVVVQDSAAMMRGGELVPTELKGRIKFQGHELFTPQTEKAPVYFFRMVFRGLGDRFAEQLLKAQIPALESGAKILIQDVVMPEHDAVPLWRERTQRSVDVALQCFSNGRERYLDEWKTLLAAADHRFTLHQVS
ncbi:S-adenosyl-L-methionine-dependent methyltransferase [Corynespora cassiicola Philippines]|uniref:S-adenosyl-L-methionine-dependent methyltransferase n=1 Tax=Corynespora cassiicola Philippines TaxID=1448308 RepID=A0A2T2N1R6_CORCC|nr:S-adenosyl-L-methionine-dependent methyltransferase [Corynespora cassiicola Philippines]